MSQSDSPSASFSTDDTTQGQVKWFNSSQGYGFLTFKDDTGADKDVFVHHSALKTSVDQYKYLVQGEYVKFTLAECEGHDCQASSVWGAGGKLMCETHFENKARRQSYNDDDDDSTVPRREGGGRGRGEGRGGGRGGGGRGGAGRGADSSGRGADSGGRSGGWQQQSRPRDNKPRQMVDEHGDVWTLVPKRGQ